MAQNSILLFCLFILIIIIILYLANSYLKPIQKHYYPNYRKCNYPHLILSPQQLETTKELLIAFNNFCRKKRITYFAVAGTLLGAIRNGGMMPFDDDIDLGILEKDEAALLTLDDPIYYLYKMKDPWNFGYKFKKRNSSIFLDIFIYEERAPGFYKIRNNLWPRESIYESEIYPLQLRRFSNMTIPIFRNYMSFLNRAYPGWQKQIRFDCGHHTKGKCFYKAHKLPRTIPVTYKNSSLMCYTNL